MRDWDKYFKELREVSVTRTSDQAFENAGKFIQDNYQYLYSDRKYDHFKDPLAFNLQEKWVQIRY